MRLDKIVLVAVVILLVTAIWSVREQRAVNAELRSEIERLSQRLSKSSEARSEKPVVTETQQGGGAMQDSANPGDPAPAANDKKQLKLQSRQAGQGTAADGAATATLVPQAEWRSLGRDTPEAAMESFMAAVAGGDPAAIAGLIVLDPAEREKIEGIMAQLPANIQRRFDTPEKLLARFIDREVDASAMAILGENVAGDEATVNLRVQNDAGKSRDVAYQFQHAADGWQFVVPAKALDKIDKKLVDVPLKQKK